MDGNGRFYLESFFVFGFLPPFLSVHAIFCAVETKVYYQACGCSARHRRYARTTWQPAGTVEGKRTGQWSIRIHDPWRICFQWDGQDVHEVAIADYH